MDGPDRLPLPETGLVTDSSRREGAPWRSLSPAWLWAASIVLVWFLASARLGQNFASPQSSRDLLPFGVFKGEELGFAIAWKLVASQWLHVKFPHMLFNALVIGVVGASLERRAPAAAVFALGVFGGALGQWIGALAHPDLFFSGASQAYLALCGIALVAGRRFGAGWWTAAAATLVAAGLDLFVSGHGALKLGHVTGFVFGLAAGAVMRLRLTARGPRPSDQSGAPS